MSRVRVRLNTNGLRLEFEGPERTFSSLVDPLLLRLATGSRAARPAAAPTAAPAAGPGAAPADAPAGAPAARGWAQAKPAAPRPAYRPPADMFSLFARRRDPSRNQPFERIAAYAFFLWNYEKRELIRREELEGCFAADETPLPERVEDVYAELERRRVFQPEGEGRTSGWRLTPKGVDIVRRTLRTA